MFPWKTKIFVSDPNFWTVVCIFLLCNSTFSVYEACHTPSYGCFSLLIVMCLRFAWTFLRGLACYESLLLHRPPGYQSCLATWEAAGPVRPLYLWGRCTCEDPSPLHSCSMPWALCPVLRLLSLDLFSECSSLMLSSVGRSAHRTAPPWITAVDVPLLGAYVCSDLFD